MYIFHLKLICNKNTTVTIEAEHYYTKDYGDPTNPYFNGTYGRNWTVNTEKGTTAMEATPNNGLNVGNFQWGIALEYNVVFRSAGAYMVNRLILIGSDWVQICVRGIPESWSDSGSDDSCHGLWRNPVTNELNFVR